MVSGLDKLFKFFFLGRNGDWNFSKSSTGVECLKKFKSFGLGG